MSTLIAYSTKYGTVTKIVKKIQELLDNNAKLIDLKQDKDFDISQYNSIIIGGAIHAGQILKPVKQFIKKNFNTLQQKKIGLFISCLEDSDAHIYLKNAFPEELIKKAAASGNLGGELIINKLTGPDKFIINTIAKIYDDVLKLNNTNIEEFVKDFNK